MSVNRLRALAADLARPHPGWTGGQYSLFRAVLGGYLLVHFLMLLPWSGELFSSRGMLPDASASPLARAFPNVLAVADEPAVVMAVVGAGALLSIALIAGWRDRIAAVLLWYIWACLLGRNPLISNPSLPFVGLLLLAHALLPRAPYGSAEGRGREDPSGNWSMPRAIWIVVWLLMAIGYSYSGLTKLASPSWLDGTALADVLDNPLARPGPLRDLLRQLPPSVVKAGSYAVLGLELGFAPLALFRSLRPVLWTTMLAMHVGLIALVDFADLSFGMVALHMLTFDPRWVPPRSMRAPLDVFFDGSCGLCHGLVRFGLAEDRRGELRFAPLGGQRFSQCVPAAERDRVPDALVVREVDGTLLTRSRAVWRVLQHLGGAWWIVAMIGRLLPRPMADALYDALAALRHRLFARPDAACPLVPGRLRGRVLA